MISYANSICHIKFGKNFSARDEPLRKNLGYFSIKNIDDPWFVTVTVHSKEYFEAFESENMNQKHKSLRKGAKGMKFENCSKRISSIREIETFSQLPLEKQKENIF